MIRLFGIGFTFLTAAIISGIAGYVSIFGMVQLFSAHATVVALMVGAIELGKLVSASWLKLNWDNNNVNKWHKSYLMIAIIITMIITSIGFFGYLSSGHLEQKAPLAGLEVKSQQFEIKLAQKTTENERLQKRLDQIDQNIAVFLQNDQASKGLSASQNLKNERKEIQLKVEENNILINSLNDQLIPLKVQTNDVEAKLGPIKYVAALFGWSDTETAVRMVIVVMMLVFDPLAVVLMLSAMISFKEWNSERHILKENKTFDNLLSNSSPITASLSEKIENLTKDVKVDLTDPIVGEVSLEPNEVENTELSDREKLFDLLEKNPAIINDMAELIASQISPSDKKDETSWLK